MKEKLGGTLYIECDGSSCKTALKTAKGFDGFVTGFRVDKKARGHGADVIIHVKVVNADELVNLGNRIKNSSTGIKGIQPTIEVRSLSS